MYKAIEYFTDLKDNGYKYRLGDTYPRDGYTPSEERINELASDKNKRGRAVIELVAESKAVAETPVKDETAAEKPKRTHKKK